jgi:SAM-dependent methyltransferase
MKTSRPWLRFVHLINFLRTCRHCFYFALLPFDYVARAINGKTDFPPLHSRRYVGPLRSFEASGAEFTCYLRLLAGLQPSDHVLDIGCGCGLMALYLKDLLDESGRYCGIDIHRASIRWCEKNITARHSNFRFVHIDVKNVAYNPAGTYRAEEYSVPFEAQSFDVILLKSVFTHMRPSEVRNYLKEVARLLKSNGRCLVTFFLLNEQRRLDATGKPTWQFSYGEGIWRYKSKHRPESAVAFEESYIDGLLEECGLAIDGPKHYGRWTRGRSQIFFQDMLILRKV